MALKQRLILICVSTALLFATLLVAELWHWSQTGNYNTAVTEARFADAQSYQGLHGQFAKAYVAHQQSLYQEARVIYAKLENSDDKALRSAVLFNMGNTYLQQAVLFDRQADSDLVLPLIELAKISYRESLSIDSQLWGAKYNLELALQLLPDPRAEQRIDLKERRGTIRTLISPDPQGNLP